MLRKKEKGEGKEIKMKDEMMKIEEKKKLYGLDYRGMKLDWG